jgi:hypothetical protein
MAACLLLAGCGSVSERESAAAAVTGAFLTAATDGDGEAACRALTPNAVEKLEKAGGKPCAEAVLAEDLPDPGPATDVDVYGQWARVRLGDGAVFLAMFPGGWRVDAAGCEPRGDLPYDCAVDGG